MYTNGKNDFAERSKILRFLKFYFLDTDQKSNFVKLSK